MLGALSSVFVHWFFLRYFNFYANYYECKILQFENAHKSSIHHISTAEILKYRKKTNVLTQSTDNI